MPSHAAAPVLNLLGCEVRAQLQLGVEGMEKGGRPGQRREVGRAGCEGEQAFAPDSSLLGRKTGRRRCNMEGWVRCDMEGWVRYNMEVWVYFQHGRVDAGATWKVGLGTTWKGRRSCNMEGWAGFHINFSVSSASTSG
eukprot:364202-Chlamydomonas_euryale.AAC.4